jgi:hypothetical protein
LDIPLPASLPAASLNHILKPLGIHGDSIRSETALVRPLSHFAKKPAWSFSSSAI